MSHRPHSPSLVKYRHGLSTYCKSQSAQQTTLCSPQCPFSHSFLHPTATLRCTHLGFASSAKQRRQRAVLFSAELFAAIHPAAHEGPYLKHCVASPRRSSFVYFYSQRLTLDNLRCSRGIMGYQARLKSLSSRPITSQTLRVDCRI